MPFCRHADTETKWAALEAAGPTAPLRHADIPWVLGPGVLPGATGSDSADLFRAVLLHGATGPADVKARLRREILRWHPDKFAAGFAQRLVSHDRDRILADVQATSQAITALMSGAGATARERE